MINFVKFDDSKHKQHFIDLNIEFLSWIVEETKQRYNIDIPSSIGITAREYVEGSYDDYTKSFEKDGIFYLLEIDDIIVGMGGLRRLDKDSCEIKRMYIRPSYRGSGFGKLLFYKLIEYGKNLGYSVVRLESSKFMTTAHHIYRSNGFKECEQFPGAETPEVTKAYSIYMEKRL
ncbi:MAG: GNAT family N-acetyltransferase [Candidatus Helarchaeota archaeon]|nr:GNAT family N-acetyltransferase [Candidatus Helarchaeota archaeon]